MEVTGRNSPRCTRRLFAAFAIGAATLCAKPKGESDGPRSAVSYLCAALANGNPTDALSVFAKSFPDLSKLADEFQALTNSYAVTCQVEVTDESIKDAEAVMTASWTLTLQNQDSGESIRRQKDVEIGFQRQNGNVWKIVKFEGSDIFA